MKTAISISVALILLCAGGCGRKEDPRRVHCDELEVSDNLRFEDVRPTIDDYCVPCHHSRVVDRFAAPPSVDFDNYERSFPYAERIATRTVDGTMPPYNSDETVEVGAVPDLERCKLLAWAQAGAPD